jgi:hypothetical protein
MVVAVKFWAGDPKPLVDNPLQASVGINYYIHRG